MSLHTREIFGASAGIPDFMPGMSFTLSATADILDTDVLNFSDIPDT
jgi:hypothetical protein